jgi:hypothetical protein
MKGYSASPYRKKKKAHDLPFISQAVKNRQKQMKTFKLYKKGGEIPL